MIELREGERLDDLRRNGAKILQNPALFCFGMDAVLLAAFSMACLRGGSRVLDLGCGNGVIPILMDERWKQRSGGVIHFTGLEINPRSCSLAERSVLLNGEEAEISILEGDLREAAFLFQPASFNLVTSNPPYMIGGHGLTGKNEALTIARHELLCTLEDVAAAASFVLAPGGKFCLVHRPFRLADLFRALDRHGLEPKRLRMVHPFADKPPNMVLLEAVKGGKPRLSCESPLIIYEKPGQYTREVRELYEG